MNYEKGTRVKLSTYAKRFFDQAKPIGDRIGTVTETSNCPCHNQPNVCMIEWDDPAPDLWAEWHVSWLEIVM